MLRATKGDTGEAKCSGNYTGSNCSKEKLKSLVMYRFYGLTA